MNENLKVDVGGDTKELIIRHGEAKPIKEPEPLVITGDIRTVYEYLQKRNIQEKDTHITVNYDEGKIYGRWLRRSD